MTTDYIIPASTVCILTLEGKVLLLEKNGLWGLPGGKLGKDETYIDAAVRELYEETGISAFPRWLSNWRFELDNFAGKTYSVTSFGLLTVEPFKVRLSSEHTDYIWVTPETALSTLPLMGPMTKSYLEELQCFNSDNSEN